MCVCSPLLLNKVNHFHVIRYGHTNFALPNFAQLAITWRTHQRRCGSDTSTETIELCEGNLFVKLKKKCQQCESNSIDWVGLSNGTMENVVGSVMSEQLQTWQR